MTLSTQSVALPSADLSIGDLWPIYLRRKKMFYITLAVVLLLAGVYCALATRRYEAKGTIEVEKETSEGLELSNVFSGQVLTPDAMTTALDLQTEADVLKSDTLALDVMQQLNLGGTWDFERPGHVAQILDLMHVHLVPAKADELSKRARNLGIFHHNLVVKLTPGTRLIDVSYRSTDAVLSAKVVNQLISDLIDFNLRKRSIANSHASEWLSGQLADLRTESENSQAKVVQLQQQMGVFSLGDTDSTGKEQVYSPVLDQVQQATSALFAAKSNTILKAAVYQVAKNGNPELISGLLGDSVGSVSSGISNSLAVIQNLREQEATLSQDIAQSAAKFGPNYPPLSEKRAALAGLQRSIADEDARIGARAKNDYEVAVSTENNTRAVFNRTQQQANSLNNKTIEYVIAQNEANQTRNLYEDLTKRLREAGLVEGLRSSNIATVDPGRTPSAPSSPNVPLIMAAALGGGLFLAGASSLFADVIDRRVQTIDEVEDGQLPLLGVVPHLKMKQVGFSLTDATWSRSAFHQAMRGLRTSLMNNDVLPPPRVILVTSALAEEGKSTVATGLSITMAQQGRRVLLVEADLYRPRLNDLLEVAERGGLNLVLREEEPNITENLTLPLPLTLPNLKVLQAGKSASDSADLLDSPRMTSLLRACRDNFDVIILDGPPLLPVTDAVSLSMLVDTTVLVARLGKTPRVALERAVNKVRMHKRKCDIRVVLNAVKTGSYAFYSYYGIDSVVLPGEDRHANA